LRHGSNAAAILIPDAERDTFALQLCQVATIHAGVLYNNPASGNSAWSG